MNQKIIDIDEYALLNPALLISIGGNNYYDLVVESAMQSIQPGIDGIPDAGTTIQFNHGTYYFNDSIVLTKGVALRGVGGSGEQSGTVLVMTNAGKFGITTARSDINDPNSNGGFYSVLDSLFISGPRQTYGAAAIGDTVVYSENNHGIYMNRKLLIRDCYICNFCGNGVEINASVADHENANHWFMENTHLGSCLGHGLYVANAGDTSAGTAINLLANGNQQWGIFDNSTFGSTYIGCAVYANTAGGYATRGMEDPRQVNSTNTSVFLNCYVEGDQYSLILPPAAAIGGNCHADPALNLTVNYLQFGYNKPTFFKSGIASFSRYQAGQPLVYASLGGDFGHDAAALVLRANPFPIANIEKSDLMWDAINEPNCTALDFLQYKNGWWEMKNPSQKVSFAFSSNKAREGECNFWMPQGFFVGNDVTRIKIVPGNFSVIVSDAVTNRTDADSLNPAVRKVGDIVINTDAHIYTDKDNPPVPQNYAGFMCVKDPNDAAGRKQTWAGFGLLELIPGSPSMEPLE